MRAGHKPAFDAADSAPELNRKLNGVALPVENGASGPDIYVKFTNAGESSLTKSPPDPTFHVQTAQVRRRGGNRTRIACRDDGAVAAKAPQTGTDHSSIDSTLQLIEGDIAHTSRALCDASSAVKGRVGDKIRLISGISEDADSLAVRSEAATERAAGLATVLEELATTSDDIGQQVRQSNELAASAQTVADEAGAGIEELKAAISQIENVVNLIADVAKQTNLLALNATIEAARAGDAGRGFAVVANEVKNLSGETQNATDEIAAKIAVLQQSAERSIGAVNRIIGQIGEIRPVFTAVAEAVERQVETTREIGDTANETSDFVREVAERADAMKMATDAATQVGLEVDGETDTMLALADAMNTRLVIMMRQTEAGDRRRHDRLPVDIPGIVDIGGRVRKLHTVDLSEGGLLFKTEEPVEIATGTRLSLKLDRIGTVDVEVVGTSAMGNHCAFRDLDPKVSDRVMERLAATRRENETYIERACGAAERIAGHLEEAIERNEITLDDLFDTGYQPVPDTDPQQFSVRALAYLERTLPDIQEPLLASDRQMAFCAAVDRNGYLPVHNEVYSKPQRPEDPGWNAANCRNMRIFDDRAGLSAARNQRPFLVQSYPRDMGNGTVVWMKEVDAPIMVHGRHWGGFRTAYKM